MIQAFNEKYQQETGASRPYFSAEQAAALKAGTAVAAINANEREFDRRLAAFEKLKKVRDEAGATEQLEVATRQARINGTVPQLLTNKAAPRADVMRILARDYMGEPDLGVRSKMLVQLSDSGQEVDGIKDHLVGRVNTALKASDFSTGVLSNEMAGVFREYTAIREQSAPAALAAFGEYGPRLDRWYRDVKEAGMPESQGFLGFLQADARRARLDPKEYKKMLNEGRDELNPKALGFLWRPGPEMHPTPMPEAIKAQIRSMRGNGNLNYVGGHLWQGSKDTTNLLTYLTSSEGPNKTRAIGTDDVHELFADAIDEAVNGKDGKYGMLSSPSSHVMVEQLPDSAGGIPNIRVHTLVNGENRQALITGASVFELADKKRANVKARAKTETGDVLRGRTPRESMKTIYE
jgi:hypothetical protein